MEETYQSYLHVVQEKSRAWAALKVFNDLKSNPAWGDNDAVEFATHFTDAKEVWHCPMGHMEKTHNECCKPEGQGVGHQIDVNRTWGMLVRVTSGFVC